jgi:Domain of unknown function (DUF5916)/Carbohydrate family 9 binding domain-like
VLTPAAFVASLAVAAAEPPSLAALRVREAVRVDGVLDEPAWSLARSASGFRQQEPKEGEPATEATEVRVLYDDETLYVGVRALDREPKKVIARVLQRDRILQAGMDNIVRWAGDDGVAVLLDPFHDHRSAFVFATNPNGAEYEALVTDESALYNADWRAVWKVAARRTPDGWVAEIAIPFRSLRYPTGDGRQPWGFNVERFVRRKSEQALWSGWSRAEGGLNRVSRAGHLVGLSGLPRPRLNLEVKPYGLAGVSRERQDDGTTPRDTLASVGGDLKWEVASGLVLDGTVNPDFAQVESDDQIVNLTRFDLFLPEKREFFLENAGVFEFGTRGLFEPPPFLLFFSRQIGIKEDEGEVPVMGGVRLSGRAGRQTVGFLSLLQDEAFGDPRTSFTALRVKRDVGANGFLGGMVTDRRTRDGGETDGGVDFSLWPTRRLNVTGFAALTSATRDRESDAAWRVGGEYRSSHLYVNAEQLVIGPDAETGMGFVTRTDIRRSDGLAILTLRPGRLGVRDVELFGGGDWITRTSGEEQDSYGFAGVGLRLDSGDQGSAMVIDGFTQLDEAFDLADRVPVPVGRYDFRQLQAAIESSPSRPVGLSVMASIADQWDGEVDSVQTMLRMAVGSHLEAGPTWTWSRADLPGGGFTAHVLGLRFGWAFSTRLFARAYVQYNSLEDKWITNLRLNFIHRPGSDLYVVFNDDQGEEGFPGRLVSRGFAVKGTWLIRF